MPAQTARAQTKRDTAEYYLAYGKDHVGKEIRLDVAFVRPVRWASPDPAITFFHALTADTRGRQPGGGILVMLPESEKDALIKKYGMNRDGRQTSTLRGTLRVLPNRERRGAGVYVVDYKGLLGERIKDRAAKLTVVDDAGSPAAGGDEAGPAAPAEGAGRVSTVPGGEAPEAAAPSAPAERLNPPVHPDSAGPQGPGEGYRRPFRRPPMGPGEEGPFPPEGRPRPPRAPVLGE